MVAYDKIYETAENITRELGKNIKLARRRRDLPVKDILELTSVSRSTLNKIEKGDPGVSLIAYIQVCVALDLYEDLFKIVAEDKEGKDMQETVLLCAPRKPGRKKIRWW